jgi:hypothetical protein
VTAGLPTAASSPTWPTTPCRSAGEARSVRACAVRASRSRCCDPPVPDRSGRTPRRLCPPGATPFAGVRSPDRRARTPSRRAGSPRSPDGPVTRGSRADEPDVSRKPSPRLGDARPNPDRPSLAPESTSSTAPPTTSTRTPCPVAATSRAHPAWLRYEPVELRCNRSSPIVWERHRPLGHNGDTLSRLRRHRLSVLSTCASRPDSAAIWSRSIEPPWAELSASCSPIAARGARHIQTDSVAHDLVRAQRFRHPAARLASVEKIECSRHAEAAADASACREHSISCDSRPNFMPPTAGIGSSSRRSPRRRPRCPAACARRP